MPKPLYPSKRLKHLLRHVYYHKRIKKWQIKCPICHSWLGTFRDLSDGLIMQNHHLHTVHGGLATLYSFKNKVSSKEPLLLLKPLKPLPLKKPTNLINDIFNSSLDSLED